MYAIYIYTKTDYTPCWFTKSLFGAEHIAQNISCEDNVNHVDIVDYRTGEVLKTYTK